MKNRVAKATVRIPDPDDPNRSHELSISWRLPSIPDVDVENEPQSIFNQAIALFMSGSRCESDIYLTPNSSISTETGSIICYSLSCELYLKLLAKISGNEPTRMHDLRRLFAVLPIEIRERVQHEYAAHLQLPPEAFIETLTTISDAFVAWRYKHEYWPIFGTPFRFRDVATALHRTALALEPSLFAQHDRHPGDSDPPR